MADCRCQAIARCTRMDDGGQGCIRAAGHTGRHKMRDIADGGKKLGDALKARKNQFVKPPADRPPSADDDVENRIAALCEIATAMGVVRVQISDGLAWVNPQTGAAAVMDAEATALRPALIGVDAERDGGDPAMPAPCALMSILGVQGLTLPDGGVLYISGGRMIVQTPSGGLRPARLELDPALGPAGDGEGR